MKEEEARKVTRQMEECSCRNTCDVCWNNLSREEANDFWKTTFKVWKSQIREERMTLHAASKKPCGRIKSYETVRIESEENA